MVWRRPCWFWRWAFMARRRGPTVKTAGSAVTCDASSPNPTPARWEAAPSSGNLTITVGPGARIESGNAHAISVGTGTPFRWTAMLR